MDNLLSGAIVMGCLACALIFIRFWSKTMDRLFAYFAACFGLLAVNYLILALTDRESEVRPYIYLIRLAAFMLIIVAIAEKNRGTGTR